MSISNWMRVALAAGMVVAGFAVRGMISAPVAAAQTDSRIFELRTYTAVPGKLDALNKRFRDHTVRLLSKHGMTHVGYWTPADPPLSETTLIYVLAHSSREAAKKSWDAFRADPDWIKARDESQKDGPLTTKVESVFLNPVDYSPMK
jgi:hypothetical protein